MKFVTYNIQYCKGKDAITDIDRIIDEVSGADVIALQEVERFWPRSGNVDQVKIFAEAFKPFYWVYGAGVDLHATTDGSGSNQNVRRQFGNMLLSKNPIIYSRHHLLPKYGSTGPLSIQRSVIEGMVEYNEQPIRLYSVHLTHLSSETRLPQIEHLLDIHNSAQFEGAPISGDLSGYDWENGVAQQVVPANAIIMGDFNFTPDSDEYDRMVGPKCDYGGRISNPVGFVDAWVATGHTEGSGSTSDINGEPVRLDYCFVSSALQNKIVSCTIDQEAKGSDHQPFWMELNL